MRGGRREGRKGRQREEGIRLLEIQDGRGRGRGGRREGKV